MIESESDFSPGENLFKYRFPRSNGDKDRLSGWKDEYDRWWFDKYCAERYLAGWLEDPKAAVNFLSQWQPQRLLSSGVIEAAVCSPSIEVSRLVVRMKLLTRRQFALALAHPLRSVYDLFDAEGIKEDELEKYKQAQISQGMKQEDVNWALEKAEEMVRKRQPFLYP